jgi:hypothetical protein
MGSSTEIDEAKLREFREYEERETQRFIKAMKYIKVLDEVKLRVKVLLCITINLNPE